MSQSMNFTSIYLLKAPFIFTFEIVFGCISKVHLVWKSIKLMLFLVLSDDFDVLSRKWKINLKKIILMHFQAKNTLHHNTKHTWSSFKGMGLSGGFHWSSWNITSKFFLRPLSHAASLSFNIQLYIQTCYLSRAFDGLHIPFLSFLLWSRGEGVVAGMLCYGLTDDWSMSCFIVLNLCFVVYKISIKHALSIQGGISFYFYGFSVGWHIIQYKSVLFFWNFITTFFFLSSLKLCWFVIIHEPILAYLYNNSRICCAPLDSCSWEKF